MRTLPFHPIHATRLPPDLQATMVERADSIEPHVIRHLVAMAPEWNSRSRLGELTLPVLLVNGRWEMAFQPMASIASDAIADLQVVELDGGHSINIEQPEAFDRAVIDFVTARSLG